jgi:FkbM family methyltransferase
MADDRELFKGTAWYYARYRSGYPASFFEHLIKSFDMDKTSRVLDLGTGTGQIAIPMAAHVKEVVAIDPEPEMLDEARRQAEQKHVTNITWLQSRAEDISSELGTFKATTMGASFHWMEQDKVLEKVYALTEEGGGVAIVANVSTVVNNKGGDAWKDIVWKTIREFLGEERRAGNSTYQAPKDRFEVILARSKFSRCQTFNDNYQVSRSVQDIIGYLGSTSFASYRLFGDRLEEFQKTLTERLLELEPSGKFMETAVVEAYLGWK